MGQDNLLGVRGAIQRYSWSRSGTVLGVSIRHLQVRHLVFAVRDGLPPVVARGFHGGLGTPASPFAMPASGLNQGYFRGMLIKIYYPYLHPRLAFSVLTSRAP